MSSARPECFSDREPRDLASDRGDRSRAALSRVRRGSKEPTRRGRFACFAAGASRARPAPLAPFGGGPFGELGRGRRQALDGDGPPLAVMGRAALDPFARPGGGGRLCDDFRPQRRDMLAATLRRRGRGRDAAGRRIAARDRLLLSLVAASAPRLRKEPAARAFTPPRFFAAPVVQAGLFPRPLCRRAPLDEGSVEIDACFPGELRAQLVAQHPGAHFRHLALSEIAEFERAERDADEAIDREPQVFEHLLDFAVLALA